MRNPATPSVDQLRVVPPFDPGTTNKDEVEGWQTRLAVTIWYEL